MTRKDFIAGYMAGLKSAELADTYVIDGIVWDKKFSYNGRLFYECVLETTGNAITATAKAWVVVSLGEDENGWPRGTFDWELFSAFGKNARGTAKSLADVTELCNDAVNG